MANPDREFLELSLEMPLSLGFGPGKSNLAASGVGRGRSCGIAGSEGRDNVGSRRQDTFVHHVRVPRVREGGAIDEAAEDSQRFPEAARVVGRADDGTPRSDAEARRRSVGIVVE